MKTKLMLVLSLLSLTGAFSQCYPVFKNFTPQPPHVFNEVFRSPYGFYYIQGSVSSKTPRTYRIWDGTSWSVTKSTLFGDAIPRLIQWKNKIIAQGRMTSIDALTPPKGKYFGLSEYRNGQWDTIPGCTFDSAFNIYDVQATRDNLYILVGDPGISYKGAIYKYDTTNLKFIKIIDYESGYYSADLMAGDKRLLVAKVSKVNGSKTNGFCYIDDNDNISLNSNSSFNEFQRYGIDGKDDHIYSMQHSTDVTIREYYKQLVSTRTGKLSNTGGGNGDIQILDGKIIWMSYNSPDYSYYNILCKGDNNWTTVTIDKNSGMRWGNPNFCKHGIFVMDHANYKILSLGSGAKVSGIAFIDLDGDCQLDSGEQVLANYPVTARSKNFQSTSVTDKNGRYELYVVPEKLQLSGRGPLSPCASDSMMAGGEVLSYTRNLPVKAPKNYDLRVRLVNPHRVRWNSRTVYEAQIENLGLPYDSAHYEFRLDAKLKYGLNPGLQINGNIARGNLYKLGYYDLRRIKIAAWIDTGTTKPDSIVCSSILGYLFRGESDSTNNRDSICQRVVYSLDPNHKDCDKEKIPVAKSTKLDYYIGFQNEGNDDAYDVVLIDTLPGSVSPETFSVIGASHPYSMTLNGRVLSITFKDIYLKPKKQDEALSQGFFKFSIYCNTGLNDGDMIKNRAFIYFDLNKPVITNTSVVHVQKDMGTSVNELKHYNTLAVYPNPSSGIVNISSVWGEKVEIYSITGELLFSGSPENGQLAIDVSAWPAGLYIAKSGMLHCKFTKTE